MCGINFSNTGSSFRELVGKSATDKVITQSEITELSENATTAEEKNFVRALQSNASFKDLKVSAFDPEKSTMKFDLQPKTATPAAAKTETAPADSAEPAPQPEPERVNLITPLIGALGLLLGALAGVANNDELNNAVNKSLNEASNAINKHGIKTPIVGKVEDESERLKKQKMMAEGKI